MRYQLLFFGVMTAAIELFPGLFIGIFTSDPAVIKEASWMVRVNTAGFFILPIQTVFQQIYLSTGQEKSSLAMVILRKLALHIPLLFILPAIMGDKVLAVVLAETISDVVSVAVTSAYFVPRFYKMLDRLETGAARA